MNKNPRTNYTLVALNNKGERQLNNIPVKSHTKNMTKDSATVYNNVLNKEGLQFVPFITEDQYIEKLFNKLFMEI